MQRIRDPVPTRMVCHRVGPPTQWAPKFQIMSTAGSRAPASTSQTCHQSKEIPSLVSSEAETDQISLRVNMVPAPEHTILIIGTQMLSVIQLVKVNAPEQETMAILGQANTTCPTMSLMFHDIRCLITMISGASFDERNSFIQSPLI